MRLKHLLYLATIACALAEIGMAFYAMYWGDILKEIAYADKAEPDGALAITRALNIALPAGILCIALLFYTRKVSKISGFALCFALGLHLIGFDQNVRAVKKIHGAETALSSVTWWYPKDKTPTEDPSGDTAALEPHS